ncbi:hypothetical protein HMN09_00342000 [Mycena chlorophos]|uniref:EF-hand domain-containing protein n=1 Tax=Mycena chlorophos TaxID=658473 RepID=A0A8H6WHY5_MYCCL|nr:hypothetical protein HMN09_00342000 [Mycena chlorophos]
MESKIQRADAALTKGSDLIREEANAPHNKKQTKERTKKILNTLQQVTSVLGGLAELDPRAKAVVGVLSGVLQLEFDRRENDENIVAICHNMVAMVYVLRFLTTEVLGDDEDLSTQLDDRISEMTQLITDFGDFADLYYTKFKLSVVRFIRATEFKQKLTQFNTAFFENQEQLQFLLNVRAAEIQRHVAADAEAALHNTELILAHLGQPTTSKEKDAVSKVLQHRNLETIVDDPEAMKELAGAFGESMTATVASAVRGDLEELLSANLNQFNLKLEGAKNEINAAIGRSTDTIMHKLESGPHELIEEEDVRTVWKDNQFRMSVKVRLFVDAIRDHFAVKLSRETAESGVVPVDKWALDILSKGIYHSAIGEAIDEDSSGYLSVHEVNRFFVRKQNYTVLTWLAFWAVGWQHLTLISSDKVSDVLDDIEARSKKVQSSSNYDDRVKAAIKEYTVTIKCLQALLSWGKVVAEGDSSFIDDLNQDTTAELEDAVSEAMNKTEESFTTQLEKLDFFLNDPALLPAITGQSDLRIEQVIMSLLAVILPVHLAELAENIPTVKDSDEAIDQWTEKIERLDTTLTILCVEFHFRMKSLIRSWRAQRLDLELQMHSYASGLFAGWYKEYTTPGSLLQTTLVAQLEPSSDSEDEEEEEPGTEDGEEHDNQPAGSADQPQQAPNPSGGAPSDRTDASAIAQLSDRLDAIEGLLKQLLALHSQAPNARAVNDGPGFGEDYDAGEPAAPEEDPDAYNPDPEDYD